MTIMSTIENVPSEAFLCVILMDVYLKSNERSDHEFLLAKLKYPVCLIQWKSSSVFNEKLSRQYFPSKMKQWYLVIYFK